MRARDRREGLSMPDREKACQCSYAIGKTDCDAYPVESSRRKSTVWVANTRSSTVVPA